MHGHNFFELAYITGGTAEHTLENEGKTISAGDYFLWITAVSMDFRTVKI